MRLRLLPVILGILVLVFAMAACEGDVGPAGPAGPAGETGAPALNTCAGCHNDDSVLLAVELQFAESLHWNSEEWTRSGPQYYVCMECHNHNGFITAVVNGEALPQSFENPAPINCRTCHQIHTTYTEDDYALTTTTAVALKVGGGVFDHGDGNLCVNCHQARPITPAPVIGGDPVNVTNSRYGPHYGPQANVMAASGLFHFGEGTPPATNDHARSCNMCHMVAPAYDGGSYLAGGHLWKLSYDSTEMIAACTQCHGSATSFDYRPEDGRPAVRVLLAELRALMLESEDSENPNPIGILNADNYAVTGTWPADLVAAFLNYKYFYHDGSEGLHNPAYARWVLENTLTAVQAMVEPPPQP